MARTEADLLRLLTNVSAAGLGEQRWEEALGALSGFFGTAGAALFDVNRATGAVGAIHTYGLGNTKGDYAERMNAINPRMHRALAQPGCHTACDFEVVSEKDIRRSEFYHWLVREVGVKYHIGSRMIDVGDVSSFVSIEFAPGRGHAETEEIELFRLITQHIANAWRFSRTFARLAAAESLRDALERVVPWGVVGLDDAGWVCSMNDLARAVVARGDGIVVRKGRLGTLRAAEQRSLDQIVANALQAAGGDWLHPGRLLAVPRRGGGAPYVMRIIPTRYGEPIAGTIAVLALILDPDQSAPRGDELEAIFGLSEREAELARLLARGWSVKAAAERMGITHNTARVHLANIMAKTRAHSQAALIALMRSLP
jgi:DNA-binding CsgD family transcriptional regulator